MMETEKHLIYPELYKNIYDLVIKIHRQFKGLIQRKSPKHWDSTDLEDFFRENLAIISEKEKTKLIQYFNNDKDSFEREYYKILDLCDYNWCLELNSEIYDQFKSTELYFSDSTINVLHELSQTINPIMQSWKNRISSSDIKFTEEFEQCLNNLLPTVEKLKSVMHDDLHQI